MEIKSPLRSVKDESGTIPVPVSSRQPVGKLVSRYKYSTNWEKERLICDTVVLPRKAGLPCLVIVIEMAVETGSGS